MPKDHGSRRIFHKGRIIIVNLNQIQYAVQDLIKVGIVLQIEKMKSGRTDNLNGRKWVTIGPYHAAVDKTYRYAMWIGNDLTKYMDSCDAAKDFVEWVGRDKAREAIREYARNH